MIAQRRVDILQLKVRIQPQYLLLGQPILYHRDDRRHRNAQLTNAWLTPHPLRVDRNALNHMPSIYHGVYPLNYWKWSRQLNIAYHQLPACQFCSSRDADASAHPNAERASAH